MHIRILLATVMLAYVSITLPAMDHKEMTVQELFEFCKSDSAHLDWAFCLAYISGVFDIMAVNGLPATDSNTRRSYGICARGVSHLAAVQAFKNWAEKHPERWSDPMTVGVMWALHELWPCGAAP